MATVRALSADATENFLLNFVREGHTVFDVGANIGQSALVAAPLVGPRCQVVSFEPNPTAFIGLQAAIERSEYENILALRVALTDRLLRSECFTARYYKTRCRVRGTAGHRRRQKHS